MKTENAKDNKNEYEQLIELLLKKYGGDNKAASLTEICDENKKYAAKIKAMGRKSRDLFGTTLAQYLKQIGVIGKKKKTSKVEEDFADTEEKDVEEYGVMDEYVAADEHVLEEDLQVARELEAEVAAGVAFEENIIKETERRISQEFETAPEQNVTAYSTEVENTGAQEQYITADDTHTAASYMPAGDYRIAEYSAASDKRRVEDIVAEELRAEEEFRRREEERRAEKERRAEEEYKLRLEEERRAEEERIAAEERIAEAARRIEEERKAEAERKAGEIRRLRELALKRYEEEYTAWILRCNKRIAEREEEFKRRLRDKQFELESAAEFKRSEAIEAALNSMIEHQKKLVEAQKILNSLWFFRFIAKRRQKAKILKAEAGIAEAKENIMRAKDIYQNEIMEIDSKVKEAEGEIRLSVERDYPMPVEPVLTGY